MMKRINLLIYVLVFLVIISCNQQSKNYKRISVDEFRDKMKGAWIGQMAGVGWGAPTEFKWTDTNIPADKVPVMEKRNGKPAWQR